MQERLKTSTGQNQEAYQPALSAVSLSVATFLAVALVVFYGAYSEGVITGLLSGDKVETSEGAQRQSPETVESETKERAPSLDRSVEKLSSRLAANPNDVEGWVLLGNSYMVMGRYDLALESFGEAKRLAPNNPDIQVSFGETLVLANAGQVTPQAIAEFDAALNVAPSHPVARYYLALSAYQKGERAKAIDLWQTLLEEAPSNAPWREAVRMRLIEAGVQFESPQAAAEIANAPPDEQAAMIQSMVEGLAARLEDDPSDLEGWRRLARSYSVLGQPQEALDRLKAAIEGQDEGTQLRQDLEKLARAIYGEGAID